MYLSCISRVLYMSLSVAPIFVPVFNNNLYRRRGERLELPVAVISYPTHDVTFRWQLPNGTVVLTDGTSQPNDVTESTLSLDAAVFGQYRLIVSNAVGSTDVSFLLTESVESG